MTIICHYRIFTNNSEILKQLMDKPITMFGAFMLAGDWVLLRFGSDMSRLWLVAIAICGLPTYLTFQYVLGRSKLILKIRNRNAQLSRTHNDIQMEQLIEGMATIKDEIIENRRKIDETR